MKSLDQIESRIDLQNAPASAVTTTDPNYHFVITQPGSYYVSANIAATKTNAIQINSAGVTLDLKGFQISRGSGAGGNGIEIVATAHHARISNGSVAGFANGIFSDVTTDRPHGCAFTDLAASGCTSIGISAGIASVLQNCRVHDTTGGSGIFAGSNSVLNNCTVYNTTVNQGIAVQAGSSLTNCTVANTTGFYGIYTLFGGAYSLSNCTVHDSVVERGIFINGSGSLNNCSVYNNTAFIGIDAAVGCSLTNCSSWSNTSTSSTSYGIHTGGESTLVGCSANDNTSTYATASSSTGVGISLGAESTATHCTATFNKGDGIQASQRSQISDCAASLNGNGVNGSGIVTDIRCVVRRCDASDNQKSGIVVLGSSVVAENTVDHNGLGGPAAGIDASGSAGTCRIEGNHARDNISTGILSSGPPGDVVIRNSVGGAATTTPYFPSSGPNFGPIQLPSNATNPMANVIF